jgi:S1-C subfamily serine protease
MSSRRQHIIYGVVFIVAMVSVALYQNSINNDFLVREQQLQQKIANLEEQLDQRVGDLQAKDQALEDNVQASLNERDQQIKMLTGELGDVKAKNDQQVAALEQTIAGLQVEFQDFSAIIDEAVIGVVSVQTNVGAGSGFIIDADDGYVVTNYHVIDGANAGHVVTYDGKRHAMAIIGSNSRADVAVLRVNVSAYRRLRFGNSDTVKVGQKAIAIGNPGGLDFTVTQGIISSVDRKDAKNNEYLQIDVPINPGNSGGPLIAADGKVIGMNTLKISGFEGVGFALKSNYVDGIVDDLIASSS